MSGSQDFYAVLHIAPEATGAEVERAYRALLRRHHPDMRPNPAPQDEAARERALLQEIMDAHAVLADPAQRALHDSQRRPTGAAPSPGPRGGTWTPGPTAPRRRPPIVVGPLLWEPPAGRWI